MRVVGEFVCSELGFLRGVTSVVSEVSGMVFFVTLLCCRVLTMVV